ncbi:MAG: T9SS type A sorting domain-containing protein [Ignavibacteriaceae bacterium]
MKKTITILLFSLVFTGSIFSQAVSYEGPAEGRVDSGAINNTGLFEKFNPIQPPKERVIKHKEDFAIETIYVEANSNVKIPESPYYHDKSTDRIEATGDTVSSILLNSFQGIPQSNSIPPDPYLAVGKDHIIGTVNSRFTIWDKAGNQLASIDADAWYSSVLTNPGAFDPKILYDHFAERWIMVFLNQNNSTSTSYFLVSVSDDSNPLGTWYSWALPSNKNGGTTVGNWSDYQGVGFDNEAIYITGNQFTFSSSFQYAKIRIIPKAQLYANTAGSCIWYDLWNIKYPGGIGGNPFGIRPTIAQDVSTPYPLVIAPSGGGNFIGIYKITNPTTTPVLTGSYVLVQNFSVPANANQLGGSVTLIDGGTTCQFRYEPIYKGGYIYAVHGINNPTASGYSAMRYYKIDALGNSLSESGTFGANKFWFFYPTLAVDDQGNIALSYSRSGLDEYAGAFYLTKPFGSTATTFQSMTLAEGMGNYVKTFGAARNRWGDYNGIWLDPTNNKDFWMLVEYAHATNTWGTWVGQVRAALEPAAYHISSTPELNFEPTEENTSGDTLTLAVKNMGATNLVINSLGFQTNHFRIIDNITYPLTLIPYEATYLNVVFEPKTIGTHNDALLINSNSTSTQEIALSGKGYHVIPVAPDGIYASSGSGKTYQVNLSTMQSSILGNANYQEVKSIAIHPKTDKIYGIVSGEYSGKLIRVSADSGDGYKLMDLPIPWVTAIAFDTSGSLYVSTRSGILYRVNEQTRSLDSLFKIKCDINSLAFDPTTNQLYGAIYKVIGTPKDRIVKVNMTTGDTTNVGTTGFNLLVQDISFNAAGMLFGLKGPVTAPTDFIAINKQTGAGTLIGNLGVTLLTAVEFAPGLTDASEDQTDVPSEFTLEQNYPNPFNPSTVIKYSIPDASVVRLVVYNLLGEVVKVLVDGFKTAGRHEVTFSTSEGAGMSSGVYFYELRAKGNEGAEKREIKKMVLMK